jgi:hypothetical protein
MKVVTLARLEKMEACEAELRGLREAFGARIPITPANLKKIERNSVGALVWFVERVPALQRRMPNPLPKTPCWVINNPDCALCAGAAAARRVLLRAARG